jgi:ketosteroid isomerase-like protein
MSNATAREPKRVVEDLLAAFGSGNMQQITELVADDVDWLVPGDPEIMPWAGHYTNRDQVLGLMGNNAGSTENLQITPKWMVSEGDKVLLLINERATVAATGQSYEVDSLHVYTIEDGKIQAFENHFNPLPLLSATFGEPALPGLPREKVPGADREIWVFFDPEGHYHHWETFEYKYDEQGRKTWGRLNNPLRNLAYDMAYAYDENGRGTGETWTNAADPTDTYSLTYRYDEGSDLVAGGKGVGANEWDFAYEYDAWGRKIGMKNTYSDGRAWEFSFEYGESGKCLYGHGRATNGLTVKITYEYGKGVS